VLTRIVTKVMVPNLSVKSTDFHPRVALGAIGVDTNPLADRDTDKATAYGPTDLGRIEEMPRTLDPEEIAVIVGVAVPLRPASVDAAGFPHITPLWFEWDDGAFWMTSLPHRPQVRRLVTNPRASIYVDVEDDERDDGERPNRQVRATGTVQVFQDLHSERTGTSLGGEERPAEDLADEVRPRSGMAMSWPAR
jgi:hypothetical protein